MSEKKSNSKADKFRNEGNVHYNRRDSQQFLEALESYNKSLCYALPASPQMSLAYANRSAVYFETKLYQKCLDNIELARERGHQKLDMLKEREEKCKNLLKKQVEDPDKNPLNFFKLSHPVSEKLPFIVNCLELRENEKFGRYVITNTELKTGDIIAIEEPVSCYTHGCTHENEYYKRCANCLKSNMLSLIPCELSCANTMYCSKDCKEEHENLIHKAQCADQEFQGVLEAVVKMVMKAVKIAGGVDELRGLVSDTTTRTVFDFDLSNSKDPMYNMNMLLVVNSLANSDDTCEETDWDDVAVHEPFKSLATSQQDRDFICKYFKHQLSLHITNQYKMKEHTRKMVPNGENAIFDPIGSGLFLFASLLNHSCDANVGCVSVENKLCIYANRPIAAGDQLCSPYIDGFPMNSLTQRQEELMRLYKFKCDCLACVNDYSLLGELIRKDRKFVQPYHGIQTVRDDILQFKKTCRYIEENFENHPCLETTIMMVEMPRLLNQIARIRLDV